MFCKGYDYEEKAELSKGYWNPKRKIWVPQFQKSFKIQRMYGNLFPNLSSVISEKCIV